MSVEFWEPWTPEIGQRVRTSVSAECGGYHDLGHGPFFATNHFRGKDGEVLENGREGVVTRRYKMLGAHAYWVQYDEPFPHPWRGQHPLQGNCYAAIELEPVQ